MSVPPQRLAPWVLVLFLCFGCSSTSAPSKAGGSAQSPVASVAPASAAAHPALPAAGVALALEQSRTAAGKIAPSGAAASVGPAAAKASSPLRDEDLIAALAKTIDDFEHLKDSCRTPTDDEDLVRLMQVSYGDLDGDGRDEVAASAMTCGAGTYGPDVYGVFRIGESGGLTLLNMEDAPEVMQGRDTREGTRGKLQASASKSCDTSKHSPCIRRTMQIAVLREGNESFAIAGAAPSLFSTTLSIFRPNKSL